MADITVKDRSLPMNQGHLESGGKGVSNLPKLINGEEYHQPSQHPSAGPIEEGPQAEDSSAYKCESPVIARVEGHSVRPSGPSGAVIAAVDKGFVKTEKMADGPVVSTPTQPRHSGTTFKR